MKRVAIAALALLGGCGARYTFANCPDLPDDRCADSATWHCAQGVIAARFGACSHDADCVLVAKRPIACDEGAARGCLEAVTAGRESDFESAQASEAARYCDASDGSECIAAGVGCDGDTFTYVASCDPDAGVCVARVNPDAGSLQ